MSWAVWPFKGWKLTVLLVAVLLACGIALCYLVQPTSSASLTLIGSHSYPTDTGAAEEPAQGISYALTLFAVFFGILLGAVLGRYRTPHIIVFQPLPAVIRTSGFQLSQRPRLALLQVFRL